MARRARATKYEKQWMDLPWQKVRKSVEVKLFSQDGELYVLAKSEGRQAKEIAIRRKKLARLLRKLRSMRRSCRVATALKCESRVNNPERPGTQLVAALLD